jgi:hypothetical protein
MHDHGFGRHSLAESKRKPRGSRENQAEPRQRLRIGLVPEAKVLAHQPAKNQIHRT